MKKNIFILLLILLFSFAIRVYKLDANPAGFFCDEASVGYNAYSILLTGKDEFGSPYPAFFRSLDDYKPPLYIYITALSVNLFGLNEYAVRFPAAFFGSLTVLVLYKLMQYFTTKKTALIGSFLLGILPWHLQMSRIGWDGQVLWVLITIYSTCLFLKAIATKNKLLLFLSIISFAFNFYTYRASWIFTPIYMFFLFLIYYKELIKKSKVFLTGATIFLILLIPFIIQITSPQGWLRFKATTDLSLTVKKLLVMGNNYFNHFSIDFLFTKGDAQFPNQSITRHSIIGLGELYLWQLPFFIFGLLFLLKIPDKRKVSVLLVWLFLYPLASSLTTSNVPYATRSIIGIVPFVIISVICFDYLFTLIKSYKVLYYLTSLIFVLLIILSVNKLLVKLNDYPLYSSDYWGWQYGPRGIISYFKEVKNDYDELIMEPVFNAPDIFFKFYAPYDCQKCLIGNLDSYNSGKKQLFAVTPETIKQNPEISYATKKVLYYPNREVAFTIIEVL